MMVWNEEGREKEERARKRSGRRRETLSLF